jgi:hypothetical protein
LAGHQFFSVFSVVQFPFFEWLAGPGCFPQIRESKTDLETLTCSSFEAGMKSTDVAGRFQIIPPLVESPSHPSPNRHFDPIGTEFVKPGRANHSSLQRPFQLATHLHSAPRNS